MPAKTTTERYRDLMARRKAEGTDREMLWLTANDRQALKERFPGPRGGIDWASAIQAALSVPPLVDLFAVNEAPALAGPLIANEAPPPEAARLVMCVVCKQFRPKLQRCDAGHTGAIHFSGRRKPGALDIHAPRTCGDFKPK